MSSFTVQVRRDGDLVLEHLAVAVSPAGALEAALRTQGVRQEPAEGALLEHLRMSSLVGTPRERETNLARYVAALRADDAAEIERLTQERAVPTDQHPTSQS